MLPEMRLYDEETILLLKTVIVGLPCCLPKWLDSTLKKKCVCIKTVKNLTFCDSLAIILWRDNQPYKTTTIYVLPYILSFDGFDARKVELEVKFFKKLGNWIATFFVFFVFCFFSLHYHYRKKKLKHKKRKWKWLHHHIVTACRSARNIKPEEKLAYL